MKLYYSPGACSLADHIALHEAGIDFEHERVDLKEKVTEHGHDFRSINPKGYVPALSLDSGETLTENIAVLDWIAQQSPKLGLAGPLGRTRVLEALAFISTEVHKSFKPLFAGGSDEEKSKAKDMVAQKLALLSGQVTGDYLLGDQPTVADCYLFVMLLWAGKFRIDVPAPLSDLYQRMRARPSVQTALAHEGLH